MAITADSRHATKTKGFFLAKMLSLVEKMEETQTLEPCLNRCQGMGGVWECCTDPNAANCCLVDDLNYEFCSWQSGYC